MKAKSKPLVYAILQQLYWRNGHISTFTITTTEHNVNIIMGW